MLRCCRPTRPTPCASLPLPAQCKARLQDRAELTRDAVQAALAEHDAQAAPVLRYYQVGCFI